MRTNVSIEHVGFSYSETDFTTDGYELHCHNHYEVYCFMGGDVDYLVEGRKYVPKPGSILLLAPHVFHGVNIKTTAPYSRYTLHFSPEVLSLERRAFLLSVFPSLTQDGSKQVYYEDVDRFHILTFLDTLKECADTDPQMQEQRVPICIEALLSQILCMCAAEGTNERSPRSDTITRVIWYLNQHLKDNISLDQLSEEFFISKHHLNKVFKKATGTTVFDYLIRKRISMAQHLLMNGYSAQEAAAESGFDDYSSFYRSYIRVLGHSPAHDKEGGSPFHSFKGSAMESVQLGKKTW